MIFGLYLGINIHLFKAEPLNYIWLWTAINNRWVIAETLSDI